MHYDWRFLWLLFPSSQVEEIWLFVLEAHHMPIFKAIIHFSFTFHLIPLADIGNLRGFRLANPKRR